MIAPIAALMLFAAPVSDPAEEVTKAEIVAVLDQLNVASSTADEVAYFNLFTPNARFVGTDPTEHWTMAQFKAFAEPWFKRDSAWNFPAVERFITLADIDCRCIAWFEETLDSRHYGATRGSGVMRRTADGWKIEQYVLSFAIPNDRSDAVVAAVRAPAN